MLLLPPKKKSGRKIDPTYNDDGKENIFPQETSQKQTLDLGRKNNKHWGNKVEVG